MIKGQINAAVNRLSQTVTTLIAIARNNLIA
jgi:muramidase (phage lysozyme)